MAILSAVPKKFEKGDTAYYLDNGKVQIVTVTGFDEVVDNIPYFPNKDYSVIDWEYRVDYEVMAYMDNCYAPVSISLKGDVLFKTKEEIIEMLRN